MQRWVWNLRYTPPAGLPRAYPMTAIYRDTPPTPEGPLARPGEYTARLTVDGKTFTQSLTLKLDPRVSAPPEAIAQQNELALLCYNGINRVRAVQAEIGKLKAQLPALKSRAGQGATADALTAFEQKLSAIEGAAGGFRGGGGGAGSGVARLAGEFLSIMNLVDAVDAQPTAQAKAAAQALQKSLDEQVARWQAIKNDEVKKLNEQLRQAGLPPLGF
jgi:uncharacterized small protein (DUF1192 family)